MQRMNIRTAGIAALLAGALALTGCATTAEPGGGDAPEAPAELTEITVGVAIRTLPAAIGAWFAVADRLGYWEEEGLDVTLQGMDGSADVFPALDAGQIDFGVESGPQGIPAAREAGADTIAVYNATTTGVFRLYTSASSDVNSLADMVGKKAGVLALGSSMHLSLQQALQEDVGIDPSQVEFIATGIGAEAQALLDRGDIDLLLVTETGALQLENDYDVREIESDYLQRSSFVNTIVAKESQLDAKSDELIAFARGIAKGMIFSMENPRAAVEIHWEAVPESKPAEVNDAVLDFTTQQLQARLASNAPLNGVWGSFDAAAVEAMVRVAFETGQISQMIDPSTVYTDRFVEAFNDFDASKPAEDARNWAG